MSADVVKQGMELVFLLLQTDREKNMLSVMKYPAYKSEAYRIADIYKYLIVKKPKYKTAIGQFFKSTNPKLQAKKIQRSFGSVSYTIIDDTTAEELKQNAQFLSSFEIKNGEIVWDGPDKPNTPY